jgi:hypothetical protein
MSQPPNATEAISPFAPILPELTTQQSPTLAPLGLKIRLVDPTREDDEAALIYLRKACGWSAGEVPSWLEEIRHKRMVMFLFESLVDNNQPVIGMGGYLIEVSSVHGTKGYSYIHVSVGFVTSRSRVNRKSFCIYNVAFCASDISISRIWARHF